MHEKKTDRKYQNIDSRRKALTYVGLLGTIGNGNNGIFPQDMDGMNNSLAPAGLSPPVRNQHDVEDILLCIILGLDGRVHNRR